MRLVRKAQLSITSLFFAACSLSEYDRKASVFSSRSSRAEADSNFKSGDYRIYSAMGFARYYPGIDPDDGRRIASKHGERMLEGTTDAIESRSQFRYIKASTDFASEYNKRKVYLIEQHAQNRR